MAGLDAIAARVYVDDLRTRFPDRVYEATNRLLESESHRKDLESRVESLAIERDNLKTRMRAAEMLLAGLLDNTGGTQGAAADGMLGTLMDADAIRRLGPALGRLMAYVQAQETAMAGVDETLGRAGSAGTGVADLLRKLARGEGSPETSVAELERRLGLLTKLPAALLAGLQQSWKAGTQGVLEDLDPRKIEADMPKRLPGLREAAVLKEQRRRYEQFWDDLDKNVEHYYRDVFRRIYVEKMEGRS
ncbi:MAG: hypothetical protein FD129_2983 [bacterium]|nr:MAG: hypothetical protein FD129_2983 [bacterium]